MLKSTGKGTGERARPWQWRRLVFELARREFRLRYAGSVLGASWAVLEPLIQFGVYLFVFSRILGMRLEVDGRVASFGFYLISGLVPFLAFQEGLQRAVGLGRAQGALLRHVKAPIWVLLAGATTAVLWRYALALALVLAAGLAAGAVFWAQVLWLPLGVLLWMLAVWGLVQVLMPAGTLLPDLAQGVALGTMVLFFLTPIVYPASLVPDRLQGWLVWNPLVGMLDCFRAAFTGAAPAPAALAVSAGAALGLAVAGGWALRRWEPVIKDLV